jgi:hypothetical protein
MSISFKALHLLLGAVFQPKGSAPSPAELELRAAQALAKLQTLVPSYIARWGCPAYQSGLLTLFSALQSPALNKQVGTFLLTYSTVIYSLSSSDLATCSLHPNIALLTEHHMKKLQSVKYGDLGG